MRILPLLFILSCWSFCFAQENIESKSLKKLYKKAWDYNENKKYDSALFYSQKILTKIEASNNKDTLFHYYIGVAKIESDAGLYDDAIRHFIEAEKLTADNPRKESHYNSMLGRLYERMEAPRIALESKIKSYNFGPGFYEAGTIAGLYIQLEEYDSAIYYYGEQVKMAKRKKDISRQISAYNNIGYGYNQAGQFDSALHYYHQSLDNWYLNPNKSSSDTFLFGMINGNIGAIHLAKGEYQTSIPFLEKDFEISEHFKENEIHVNVGELLYRSYTQTNHP